MPKAKKLTRNKLNRNDNLRSRKLRHELLESREMLSADFGDAPAPFPVELSANGARHEATGPIIGLLRDAEADGTPTADASGDGLDEDGIVFGTLRVGTTDSVVMVDVSNAPEGAQLDAWIDFNGDRNWGGNGEKIASSVGLTEGTNVVWFDIPATALSGETVARFRLSTAGGLGIGGAANDGEIEDHIVNILPVEFAANSFAPERVINASQFRPEALTSGDVDGDGDQDLLVGSRDGDVFWYENVTGFGDEFIAHQITDTGFTAGDVLLADMDGDADLDVVVATETDETIAWYENVDGVGEDFSKHSFASNLDAVGENALADFDGDGDVDVLSVSTHDDKIVWHENRISEGLPFVFHSISTGLDGPRGVSTADIDGDGDLDLFIAALYADKFAWFENRLSIDDSFAMHLLPGTSDGAHRIHAVDFDRDGDIDGVAASIHGNKISWFENADSVGGEFVEHEIFTSGVNPMGAFPADIDGDEDWDILSYGHDDVIRLHLNAGNGDDFSTQLVTEALDLPYAAPPVDVNGDGILDVVAVGFYSNRLSWFSGQINSPPTDISLSASSVNENLASPTVIGTLTTSDPDMGDGHTYLLVNGDGDTDNEQFEIDGDQLEILATADYEAKSSYAIRVRSTDNGGLNIEKPFEILVLDLPEFVATPQIGDGTGQRSFVDRIVLTFDSDVDVGDGAFSVRLRPSGSSNGGDVDTSFTKRQNESGNTEVTIQFAGVATRGPYNTLVDGNYDLTVDGTKILREGLGLDANQDGTGGDTFMFGDSEADAFYAFFGDANSDRAIIVDDFLGFRNALGSSIGDDHYRRAFDGDFNDVIDVYDFILFRDQFGTSLDFE